jgi:hypothetical protein
VSSVEWAGLAIVAALVFIVLQHLYIRKLTATITGIATGRLEFKVDGTGIHIRHVDRSNH